MLLLIQAEEQRTVPDAIAAGRFALTNHRSGAMLGWLPLCFTSNDETFPLSSKTTTASEKFLYDFQLLVRTAE